MSVRQRIAAALAAHAFGQAVTVLAQLLLTPLYFRHWGAALYGEWLILSSIPAYLVLGDLGLGSAAGNEMSMRAGAGDRLGAAAILAGALRVSAAAAALMLLLGLAVAAVALHGFWPATTHIAAAEAAWVLLGLAATVALGFPAGVLGAGFRCAGRNALGIMLANATRLAEVLLVAALLLAGAGPTQVCLGMVLLRTALLALQAVALRRSCAWLFDPQARASLAAMRRLLRPALGFLAFPLGNALALQGPILLVGAAWGGAAVALFATLRTLARLPMQLTNMVNASVWPELSRAWGARDLALLRHLHRLTWGTTTQLMAGSALVLLLAGPALVRAWLGPQGLFDAALFALLLAWTLVAATWGASAVVLTAINAHLRVGLVFVLALAAGLALAQLMGPALGWAGLLGPLLAAEAALLLWVMARVLQVSGDAWLPFLRAAATEPWRRLAALRPR